VGCAPLIRVVFLAAGFWAVLAFLVVVVVFFAVVAAFLAAGFLVVVAVFLAAGFLAVVVAAGIAAFTGAGGGVGRAGATGIRGGPLRYQAPAIANRPGIPYATTKVVVEGSSTQSTMNWKIRTTIAAVANPPSTEDCQVAAPQANPAASARESTIHPSAVPNNWMAFIQA
jgi:energy-coupling factor transporter transmembrane protein EcfT